MRPRINMVTLGVKSLQNSRDFYEKILGWKVDPISTENFVLLKLENLILFLYPEELLAEDAHVEYSPPSFRGVALAHNVGSKTEVTQIINQLAKAGTKILKPAQEVFWGGFSGYFADPDGHMWEVAWNPYLLLKEDGSLQLPNS